MAEFTFVSENKNLEVPGSSAAPPSIPPAPSTQYKNIRFGAYNPAAPKGGLNARSLASDVRLAQLKISDAQRVLIESMYAIDASNQFGSPPIIDHVFSADHHGQRQASAILAQHYLDVGARDAPGNHWSTQWSERGTDVTNIKRVLYLCSCGYDHTKRNTKYDHKQHHDHAGSRERHNPFPFTGCLAHAEVTLRSSAIVRIRGHFEHNQKCKDTHFTRMPPIPLHPNDDGGADDDDDDASVATDASSDSDSDAEDSPVITAPPTTQSAAALKEHILARTLFELREVGSKLSHLGDYLQQSPIAHLNDDHRQEVGIGRGQIAYFLMQLDKLLDLPDSPPSTSRPISAPLKLLGSALKRKASHQLLPPSPEKLQQRHDSFAPH